jgi:hypothetical protein
MEVVQAIVSVPHVDVRTKTSDDLKKYGIGASELPDAFDSRALVSEIGYAPFRIA